MQPNQIMTFRKTVSISLLILAAGLVLKRTLTIESPRNPNAGLNVVQLIQKFGYPVEIHEVFTEDGYILKVHRIPHGKERRNETRIPILLVHGILQSSAEFINLGPNKALGLLLADKGYDVWLANTRGNTWSRNHDTLDPDSDSQFWSFSFHEIGYYDLPAIIDRILEVTGEPTLHYVGYSQGTSAFFVLASERPQYGRHIRLMTALAPAVFMENPQSPFIYTMMYFRKAVQWGFSMTICSSPLWLAWKVFHMFPTAFRKRNIFQHFFQFLDIGEMFPEGGPVDMYLKHICDDSSMFVDLCLYHQSMLHGHNADQLDRTILPVVYSNMPAGMSSRQIIHFLQLSETGTFKQYDLGPNGNLMKYQKHSPPEYNLTKVTTPLAIYYGANDWLVHFENVEKIKKAFPRVVKTYKVPMDKFHHGDFLHAKDVVRLLYNEVIDEILKY